MVCYLEKETDCRIEHRSEGGNRILGDLLAPRLRDNSASELRNSEALSDLSISFEPGAKLVNGVIIDFYYPIKQLFTPFSDALV